MDSAILSFTQDTALIRAYCGGVTAVSAIVLTGVFVRYIALAIRDQDGWWKDLGVQAAGALIVLMVGHIFRAASSWTTFLWVSEGWNPSYWVNSWFYIIAATVLVMAGKILMLWAFSPLHLRWIFISVMLVLSLSIPAVVSWLI
jgi:hypothetical protein